MFSLDGKFFKGLMKIGDFLILGIVGVVFSLPIITLGASITGMFYAGMKLAKNEESYVFKDFWHSFKSNFKQAFILELILGVAAAILIQNINNCLWWGEKEGTMTPVLFLYATIGLILVLVGIIVYVFPLLAKFNNTVFGTLKNGLLLCMKHLPQTFVMLLCTCGLVYFSLTFPPFFLITVPLICYIDSYIMSRVLAPYVKQAEAEAEAALAQQEAKELEEAEAAAQEEAKKLAEIMGREE